MFKLTMGINSTARRAIEIIPFLDMFKFSVFSFFVGRNYGLIANKYLQEKGNRISFYSIFVQKT